MQQTLKTTAFYTSNQYAAEMLATSLIRRGAWFTVDPYPEDVYRFDVKPEAARYVRSLGVTEDAP